MVSESALATRANPLALSFDMGAIDPVRALEKAQEVVTFMTAKCTGKQYIAIIGDRKYPRVEWWTTAGMALGLFPYEISNEAIDLDGYRAYLAIYEVRHGGQTVTRASAICARSEEKWADRDEYALRSMAATRAVGKAYRIGLAGLAVMAGLEPTPAEEIGEGEQPAPYGTCPDHGVQYFQSGKMRSPAHKLDGGGWCDKPKDRTVEGTAKAAATAPAKPAPTPVAPAPTAREAAAKPTATVPPPRPHIDARDAPPAELGPNQKKFRELAKQRFQQWGEAIAWSRNTIKDLMAKAVTDWTESEWERLTVLFEIEREEAQQAATVAAPAGDGTQGQLGTGAEGEYHRV